MDPEDQDAQGNPEIGEVQKKKELINLRSAAAHNITVQFIRISYALMSLYQSCHEPKV